jgi:hypothetical protein
VFYNKQALHISRIVSNTSGRPERRWEDNIKRDFREIRWGGMDWIHLPQDRDHWKALVNTAVNLLCSIKCEKFSSNRATGGFLRRT